MPAKTTVKVAVINNAAKDDYFQDLSWLAEDASLQGTLSVLGNDPGSAKIIGWSDSLPTTQAQLTSKGELMGGKLLVSINPTSGELDIDATGLNADFQHLGAGDTAEYSFYYTAQMANGAYSTAKVTFVVEGENDLAVISGDNAGSVTEDDDLADSGALSVADVDDGEAVFAAVAAGDLDGDYGNFTFDSATGQWTYDLDNDAVQGLGAGATRTDTLTVSSLDGTDSETITVTIHGKNDAATIGGDNAGSVMEDGVAADGGTLSVVDVDDGEAVFKAVANEDLAGDYGTFTFDEETGEWTYVLDNDSAQALGEGVVETDTLTVVSLDGTDSETITVTIHGKNDAATISGDNAGSVTEDDDLADSGTLSVADVDDGEAVFAAVVAGDLDGDYGTFTFDEETGEWTYDLDNDAVQGLGAGATRTDTLTVVSLDGTDSETITVTIHGKNDAATISGDNAGSVTEDDELADSGTLSVADVDDGEAVFAAVAAGDLDGDYGTFTFDEETGEWTYDLDNDAAQGLGADETKTDTLTVYSLDGTDNETITVTIVGKNDAAQISGDDSGEVTEDDAITQIGGTLGITDIDGEDEEAFQTQTTNGAYGTFTLNADGTWTYEVDGDATAFEALDAGQTDTEEFTVVSLDGTTHVVTITVNGANETPTYTSPPVYSGPDADPNDFDSSGNPLGTTQAGGNTGNTLYGGAGNDVINGNNGDDVIYGGSGNDALNGNNHVDTLFGGSGNDNIQGGNDGDTIIGGYGADTLSGNGGNDVFKYLSARDTGDTILDFETGDTIDVSAFSPSAFVGALAAPGAVGANEIGFITDGGVTTIYIDTDGVAGADLEIYLSNGYTPVAADFVGLI